MSHAERTELSAVLLLTPAAPSRDPSFTQEDSMPTPVSDLVVVEVNRCDACNEPKPLRADGADHACINPNCPLVLFADRLPQFAPPVAIDGYVPPPAVDRNSRPDIIKRNNAPEDVPLIYTESKPWGTYGTGNLHSKNTLDYMIGALNVTSSFDDYEEEGDPFIGTGKGPRTPVRMMRALVAQGVIREVDVFFEVWNLADHCIRNTFDHDPYMSALCAAQYNMRDTYIPFTNQAEDNTGAEDFTDRDAAEYLAEPYLSEFLERWGTLSDMWDEELRRKTVILLRQWGEPGFAALVEIDNEVIRETVDALVYDREHSYMLSRYTDEQRREFPRGKATK